MPATSAPIGAWNITIAELITEMQKAELAADSLGYTYTPLTGISEQNPGELGAFRQSFQRQLILQSLERDIIDLYVRHIQEMLMGAMIAKPQMNSTIDGEQPASGKIGGPLMIRPAWLGVGQDWDDVGAITMGSAQSWMHAGTTLMGGTSGNAVKIGTNQVTVIFAQGSLHPSPKLESVQFTIDGKPRQVLNLQQIRKAQIADNALQIKEFDSCYVFKKGTTVLAKIIGTSSWGTSVYDIPYLLGASFIKEDIMRVQLASSIPGTTNDTILTT